MAPTDVIDVDFPVGRPKLRGGGCRVDVVLECRICKRKETRVITIKFFGEKRVFGCRQCGSQMEVEVRPKRLSHI